MAFCVFWEAKGRSWLAKSKEYLDSLGAKIDG